MDKSRAANQPSSHYKPFFDHFQTTAVSVEIGFLGKGDNVSCNPLLSCQFLDRLIIVQTCQLGSGKMSQLTLTSMAGAVNYAKSLSGN